MIQPTVELDLGLNQSQTRLLFHTICNIQCYSGLNSDTLFFIWTMDFQ